MKVINETTTRFLLSFEDFFQVATGFRPFLWQSRLAEEVSQQGRWPDQIALPTGVGKSQVVSIWLYRLAQDLRQPGEGRSTPLRLIYVVDRRMIVDAIDQQARHLSKLLSTPESDELRILAETLRPSGSDHSLHVSRLRGGVPSQRSLTAAPHQPTVITSTVDQAGSRLLFRGYGVSNGQRPIHAGLLGLDSLFIVDEAHLTTPFVQTLHAIREAQRLREQIAGFRPLRIVAMSATLPDPSVDGWVFSLNDAETDELADRLQRPKNMHLIIPSKASKKEQPPQTEKPVKTLVNEEELTSQIKKQVSEITKTLETGIGVVVVNHVSTARRVFTELQKLTSSPKVPIRDIVLLTARIRGYDRDRLMEHWLPEMDAKRPSPAPQHGMVWVVATQTIEVGADFDFAAMVTECAPLPALRQRFGRLNRLGRHHSVKGSIVPAMRAMLSG